MLGALPWGEGSAFTAGGWAPGGYSKALPGPPSPPPPPEARDSPTFLEMLKTERPSPGVGGGTEGLGLGLGLSLGLGGGYGSPPDLAYLAPPGPAYPPAFRGSLPLASCGESSPHLPQSQLGSGTSPPVPARIGTPQSQNQTPPESGLGSPLLPQIGLRARSD